VLFPLLFCTPAFAPTTKKPKHHNHEIPLLLCTTKLASIAKATPPHTLRSTAHALSIVSQSDVASKGATGRPVALKHCRVHPSMIGSADHRLLRPCWCQWPTLLTPTRSNVPTMRILRLFSLSTGRYSRGEIQHNNLQITVMQIDDERSVSRIKTPH